MSKSVLGDTLTTTEFWHIIPDTNTYLMLQFETFDVGCHTDSALEIETSPTEKLGFCNNNKAEVLRGLKTDGEDMKITFQFARKASYLIEGFGARYMQLSRQPFEAELVSEEASGT